MHCKPFFLFVRPKVLPVLVSATTKHTRCADDVVAERTTFRRKHAPDVVILMPRCESVSSVPIQSEYVACGSNMIISYACSCTSVQCKLFLCNNILKTSANICDNNLQLTLTDNWSEKACRRRTQGVGRMKHLKKVYRRFRYEFLEFVIFNVVLLSFFAEDVLLFVPCPCHGCF